MRLGELAFVAGWLVDGRVPRPVPRSLVPLPGILRLATRVVFAPAYRRRAARLLAVG